MLAQGRPEGAVGWMLVCRELGLLGSELVRVHRARGELDRARELEVELGAELARVRAGLPQSMRAEPLDRETEAARGATDPLGPAKRQAPEPSVNVDAVKRLIDPTRRRRPRQR